jgi:hypothetical protein
MVIASPRPAPSTPPIALYNAVLFFWDGVTSGGTTGTTVVARTGGAGGAIGGGGPHCASAELIPAAPIRAMASAARISMDRHIT